VAHKPTVIVAGGFDVVSIPAIGYGQTLIKGWRSRVTQLGLKLANRVLLFSESCHQTLLTWPGIRPERLKTLYLGIDCDHFRPSGAKSRHALTVGYFSEPNLRRKGYLTFIAAAMYTPDVEYRIGGMPVDPGVVDLVKASLHPNTTYLGHLDDRQLLAEYQNAKVYAQLSLHEGFGMALAEAMACGCIPVVTDRGSMPEVVGDTGVYVPPEDPRAAAAAIAEMIYADDGRGRRARERVLDLFTLKARQAGLLAEIEQLVSEPGSAPH
jgi:glycosyltransferase involved in cell wall biosynthesis